MPCVAHLQVQAEVLQLRSAPQAAEGHRVLRSEAVAATGAPPLSPPPRPPPPAIWSGRFHPQLAFGPHQRPSPPPAIPAGGGEITSGGAAQVEAEVAEGGGLAQRPESDRVGRGEAVVPQRHRQPPQGGGAAESGGRTRRRAAPAGSVGGTRTLNRTEMDRADMVPPHSGKPSQNNRVLRRRHCSSLGHHRARGREGHAVAVPQAVQAEVQGEDLQRGEGRQRSQRLHVPGPEAVGLQQQRPQGRPSAVLPQFDSPAATHCPVGDVETSWVAVVCA